MIELVMRMLKGGKLYRSGRVSMLETGLKSGEQLNTCWSLISLECEVENWLSWITKIEPELMMEVYLVLSVRHLQDGKNYILSDSQTLRFWASQNLEKEELIFGDDGIFSIFLESSPFIQNFSIKILYIKWTGAKWFTCQISLILAECVVFGPFFLSHSLQLTIRKWYINGHSIKKYL